MSKQDQYCRECGTSIPAGNENCPKCGHRVSQVSEAATRTPSVASKVMPTSSSVLDDMVSRNDNQPGKYQIADGFMLNTRTGDIWKYDEDKNAFRFVQKEETYHSLIDQIRDFLVIGQESQDLDADIGEELSLKLQMAMERRSKIIQTLSNIMKKISTTQDTIVRNIK